MADGSAPQSRQLGRFCLHTRLAVGGMAEVWLARQEGPAGFAKELVVKTILPQLAEDQSFVQMFLDEARLAAQLSHPNVVQIFELGKEADTYFLVMEYLRGRNLRAVQTRLRERKEAFPAGILAHILVGTCEGLHYAHQATDASGAPMRLVHRDVSPDNILLSFDGQAKVVDFGIAKAASASVTTRPGTLKGKFGYMSPEQAMGRELDCRADIYSLGVVLYELLSGAPPFRSNSELGLLNAILETTPPPLETLRADIPRGLAAVVLRAMAKEREQRFSSAREMGLALDAWLRQGPSTNVVDVASFLDRLFGAERAAAPSRPPRAASRPGANLAPQSARLAPSPSGAAALPEEKQAAAPAAVDASELPEWRWLVASTLAALALGAAIWAWHGSRRLDPVDAPLPPPLAAANLADAAGPVPFPIAFVPDAAAPAARPDPVVKPPAVPAPVRQLRCRIAFRVNPWAEVTLDGQRLGTTPLPPAEVAPGRHTVVLENREMGVRRVLPVEVRAGKEATVRVNFLE